MTHNDLAEILFEMTKRYFVGATVVWGQSKMVKPAGNLIVLRFGATTRNLFPLLEFESTMKTSYQMSTVFEVNLFTGGMKSSASPGRLAPKINTAGGDMLDYLNYVGSPFNTDWLAEYDICLLPKGDVQNLTAIINGISWEYRAMAEFDVTYRQTALGAYALGPESGAWQMTASGGGSEDLADAETGYFESVVTEETE
jgi:hypothetical protein